MPLALALLAVSLPAWAAPPVTAAPTAAAQMEGREHFGRGLALYRDGDFGGARAEFQRAYDVAPSYRILFNVGESSFELQDYAGAITAFRRYLGEGGEAIPAARRAEVGKTLSDLDQRVGRLVVTTSVVGADIAVDGVRVGVSPLAAPVVVSVGRRTLTATLPGRVPVSRTLDVAGGDRTNVSLDLAGPESAPAMMPVGRAPVAVAPLPAGTIAEASSGDPVLSPAMPGKTQPARSRTPFWVGLTVTGALVATSVVFGVLTVESNATLNSRLGQFPGSAAGIASARSNVHAYALAADVLGATAIAAAGVTVYLGVTRRPTAGAASVAVGPATARLNVLF